MIHQRHPLSRKFIAKISAAVAFIVIAIAGCSGNSPGRGPVPGEAGTWLVKSPWHERTVSPGQSKVKDGKVDPGPAVLPLNSQPGQTNFAGCGPGRTWSSGVTFENPGILETLWTYEISEHTFAYEKQTNIWSTCAVTLSWKNKTLVIVGAYDRKVHCLDGFDGSRLWRFTAGGEIVQAPTAAIVDGRPMIFFTSTDRTIYALGADGAKIWSFEAMPWSYTVTPSTGSSPILFRVTHAPTASSSANERAQAAEANPDGEILMAVTMGLVDAAPLSNIQSGEVMVLRCSDGKVVWRKRIGSTPPVSPTLAAGHDGKGYLIVPDTSGTVWCLDPATGSTRWRFTADYFVHGSASITPSPGFEDGVAAFGTRFGVVSFLSVTDGATVWSYRAGHYVDATPTRLILGFREEGKTPATKGMSWGDTAFFGSYDRSFYALRLPGAPPNRSATDPVGPSTTPQLMWRFPTENQILSAALAVPTHAGPCLFVPSFDRTLYCLDAATGRQIWTFAHGELIFPYIRRGDANFSSPTAFVAGGQSAAAGKPRLLYPAFDGKLYCFGAK